jgi:hypothetical protein
MYWPRLYKRHVFISYSHQHLKEVSMLADVLSAGLPVYVDKRSLKYGENWRIAIKTAIRKSSLFYLFWCGHAAESVEVEHEISVAIRYKVPIRPIMMSEHALPCKVRDLHAVTSTKTMCQASVEKAESALEVRERWESVQFSVGGSPFAVKKFFARRKLGMSKDVLRAIDWGEIPDLLANDITTRLKIG